MYRAVLIGVLLLALPSSGQIPSAPDGSMVLPGITPDERVDVTGDGIPDLVITSILDATPDPEQGLSGWYRRHLRTLPGTSLLQRSTHNNYGYYLLAEGAAIDTAALAKGFHFKQLQWTPAGQVREFRLLEQAYGPGIGPELAGWYGTGEYADGTMLLRSTAGGRTRIAAFTVAITLPSGRISVAVKEVVSVPFDFGKEGDPPLPMSKVDDPYAFGHEEQEPQIIIPPGLPPDEAVDLTFDEVPDVIITGYEQPSEGFYTRGVSPAPGAAFLMQRAAWGGWELFQLGAEEALTPGQLASGLETNILMWASPGQEGVFCPVLHHRNSPQDGQQGWVYVHEEPKGDPVFRTMHYSQPVIGVVALQWTVPGGELGVDPQNWVEEGKVLQVR